MSQALVSVVVTTRNEERNIERCLDSVKAQSYPNIEIIVVDNASSDKTKDLARKYTDKVFDKGPERSAQRNYGVGEIAKGEYVLFLDADMICAPSLVKVCVSQIQRSSCLALYIPEIILGVGVWSKIRRFERSFYDGTSIDVVRFFTKEAFCLAGGFDEKMSGPEDWDFDKKIRRSGRVETLGAASADRLGDFWPLGNFVRERGVDPGRHSAVIYHDESNFDLPGYLRKKGYYSRDFTAYISKWGQDDPDVKKQFGLCYRYFGVFVENGKWKKLLRHPLLAAGMYLLRALVGAVFISRKLES